MPTLKMNSERENLIKDISGILREIENAENVIKYYWKVGVYAEKLIINILGEEGCKFPVDIEALAYNLGIEIEEENLNENSNINICNLNRKIGQLVIREDSYTKEKRVVIYVDKLAPPSSRRYAIANEIVHYLLHYQDTKFYENYFIMPLCPTKMEEIAADIFSVFLLIPIRRFLVEFSGYVKYRVNSQKVPITTEEWLRYLSERSVLSDYYVAYGYQHLRAIGYWVYQAWNADEEQREAIKMTQEDKNEIIAWMTGYYDEEYEHWLFQD